MMYFFLGSVFACSCEKASDPVSRQGFTTCEFDWKNVLTDFPRPEVLRYCFYSGDNQSLIRIDSEKPGGMRFALPAGRYQVIIFNCEPETVPVDRIERFDACEAYLPVVTKAADLVNGEKRPLYVVVMDSLVITPDCDQTIRLTPEPIVKHIRVKVNLEKEGVEQVRSCQGTLAGIVTAVKLSNREKVNESPGAASFDMRPTDRGLEGNIIVLGAEEADEKPEQPVANELKLDFTFQDGSTVSSTTDLGSGLDETPGPNVPVEVEIDAVIQTEPAFSVRLTRWKIGPGDSSVIR